MSAVPATSYTGTRLYTLEKSTDFGMKGTGFLGLKKVPDIQTSSWDMTVTSPKVVTGSQQDAIDSAREIAVRESNRIGWTDGVVLRDAASGAYIVGAGRAMSGDVVNTDPPSYMPVPMTYPGSAPYTVSATPVHPDLVALVTPTRQHVFANGKPFVETGTISY
jgi:hypothetical protein